MHTKKGITGIISVVLAATLLFGSTALAADPQPITSSGEETNYFVYTKADGSVERLDRRNHALVSDGSVAYCVEAGDSSPHEANSYEDGVEVDDYYNATIARGIEIILFYGYPSESAAENGLSDRQARYATQVAISCWLAHNGVSQGSNLYNLSANNLRSDGTAGGNACWNYMMELYNDAINDVSIVHAATLTPLTSTAVSGGYFVRQFSVSITNCDRGYTLDSSSLPSGSIVEGYTGANGDTITVRIPISGNFGQSFSFTVTGQDSRTMANIIVQESTNESVQSVMYVLKVAQPGDYDTGALDSNLLGQITITKTDAETGSTAQAGLSFAGASFHVTGPNNYDQVIVADASGVAKTGTDLLFGTYTVTEITAPTGYTLNATPTTLTLSATSSVVNGILQETGTIADTVIKGRISVQKVAYNSVTGDAVPETEAQFQIYSTLYNSYDETPVSQRDIISMNSSGTGTSTWLPYGEYRVVQIAGKEGYSFVPSWTVTISSDGETYSFTKVNPIKTAQLRIVKADAESGEQVPVAGTEFQIYHADTDELVTQTLTYPNPTTLSSFVTDGTGAVTLPEVLAYGEYYIVEINAPNGYLLSSQRVYFDVTGTDTLVEVTQTDYSAKGTITVEKTGLAFTNVTETDSDYGTVYSPVFAESGLSGAVFTITAAEDIYTANGTLQTEEGTVVGTLTTDETGTSVSGELYLGKYNVQETTAPEGYVLDDTVHEVELIYRDQNTNIVNETVSLENTWQRTYANIFKEAEIYVYNEDGNGNIAGTVRVNPGEGFTFGLFADEDITLNSQVVISAGSLVALGTTDKNGELTFDEYIPHGTYYVKELSTSDDYLLNDDEYPLDFAYAGQDTVSVELTANPEAKVILNKLDHKNIVLSKTDITGQNPLEGATFEVIDETGTIIFRGDTNAEGKVSFDITPGTYTFHEIAAPTGYAINPNTFTFTVNKDGSVTGVTEIKDTPNTVTLLKTGSDGSPLPGATIEVYNKDGSLYFTGVTNEEGKIVLTYLPVGTYTFKETAAPNGYQINTTTFSFTIDKYGTVSGETNIKDEKVPKTGVDEVSLSPFAIVLLSAGALFIIGGVIGTIVLIRKKKNEKE